jgi:hypothetical protein
MADASADIVFNLELTEQEAIALCELTYAADWDRGEGPAFKAIFNALAGVGVCSSHLTHRIVENEVIVENVCDGEAT